MIFKCSRCGPEVREKPRFIKCLTEFAYDPEWLEVGEPVPPLEERVWFRADTLPKVGERRMIKVGRYTPFDRDIGDCFNAQGDCDDRRLVYRGQDGTPHLILQCEWGWHGGFVLFGNAVEWHLKRGV